MGDRVAVLNKGYLMQVASPQELYENPENVFVAGFIGSPSMNLIESTLTGTAEAPVVDMGSVKIAIDPLPEGALRDHLGQRIVVGLRPEDMEDVTVQPNAPADRRIRATAKLVESLGSEIIVHFPLDAKPYIVHDAIDDEAETGIGGDDENMFVARISPRSPVTNGADIELGVDSGRFHYFDIESGLALH